MESIEIFENFFKPEVRKSGQDLVKKEAVYISNGSDTQIQANVRAGTPAKVNFSSASIADVTFYVDCSCSPSAKGQFCKHIWATLLVVVQKYPDFLDSKTNIEKASSESASASSVKARQLKEKQSDYRKLQYQKQKLRVQKIKLDKKRASYSQSYPTEVQNALSFFAENGFDLTNELNEQALNNTWKKLHRVFHPDIGGSHAESIALNKHFDVLEAYLRKS